MKSRLSSFSIIVSFVCLILTGVALTPLLPVKLSPSKKLNDISVSFSMVGQSPRIVESEVTSQIEAMLSRIEGVRDIRSTSGNGWGRVDIGIDKHADVDAVRFEVSTVVRQLWPQLPKGVSYPGISSGHSSEGSDRPFLTYTLNAPSEPNLIFKYAEETLKPILARTEGVDRIDVSGAMPMEWQLEYDYEQLRKLGISLSDLQRAISQSLESGFLGMGDQNADVKDRNYCTLALSPESGKVFDPAKIAVKRVNGKMIYLNQLVKVSHREEAPQSYFRINGLNSIYISVYADEQANQLDLGRKIKGALAGVQCKLPRGYELHMSYDATEYIRNELHKIVVRTGLTILILLLFVLLISRSFKYLTLIVLSLLANLAVAVIFYYLLRLEMQLYSLAGITISLGLVIDNVIVMTDHLLHRKNKKVFVAILAATLTTIAALTVIFFLEDKVRLNLQDFALVVIVNLAVSLAISLFLVPALVDKLGLDRISGANRSKRRGSNRWKRFPKFSTSGKRIVCFNKGYIASLHFVHRFRVVAFVLIILTFGLPVFMLPEKWEGDSVWHKTYNQIFGTDFYNQTLREYVDMGLGGTLRLFTQKVYEGGSFSDREGTSLYVTASMPNGATLKQMNETVRQMEAYITTFRGIRQFQTSIYSSRKADISITFTKEAERNGLPYSLKSQLIAKALTLGDASWSVSGLGDGFSNDLKESAGSYRVSMMGYNYDELMAQAEELKRRLLTHQRIKEVLINSEYSWYKDDYQEFAFDSNPEKLAQKNLNTSDLYSTVRPLLAQNVTVASVPASNGAMEDIRLCSKQSIEYDIWSMNDVPHDIMGRTFKVSDLASVKKEQTPQQVQKENQQYKLCLQYDYIGAYEQGNDVLKEELNTFSKKLPMGYSVKNENEQMNWGGEKDSSYKLLFLIVVMIFFICSILFNSLVRPLAVIMTIPISFIGIFISYYMLQIKFDQGGLAAFVLLSGLTVNSAIYILNDYDSLCREKGSLGLRIYLKSFNGKIIPILLTILSTVLGFVPFLIGSDRDPFWYSLAVGTIGGLIFSLIAIVVYLPVMVGIGSRK